MEEISLAQRNDSEIRKQAVVKFVWQAERGAML